MRHDKKSQDACIAYHNAGVEMEHPVHSQSLTRLSSWPSSTFRKQGDGNCFAARYAQRSRSPWRPSCACEREGACGAKQRRHPYRAASAGNVGLQKKRQQRRARPQSAGPLRPSQPAPSQREGELAAAACNFHQVQRISSRWAQLPMRESARRRAWKTTAGSALSYWKPCRASWNANPCAIIIIIHSALKQVEAPADEDGA